MELFMNFFMEITKSDIEKIIRPVVEVCSAITPALLTVVGALGAIWCILLGVKYAKADDPQEHEKTKRALINAIVGFVLIFILLIMLNIGVDVFKKYYTNYEYEA